MNKPRKDLAGLWRKYEELKKQYDTLVTRYKAHLARCPGEAPSVGEQSGVQANAEIQQGGY